ncbi:MAG: sigma 54-interacting transcriptional regulator [Firmicutes bacterium]|nr:sigma 54-interacting transcriptional regulator [Bacillota bacterium]
MIMDQARIVMISPLPELTRLARQISRELSFKMDIVEAFLDKGVELGKRLEQSGAEVVISRGPTGVLLKKELSIPVILIQITSFDIIQALNRAKGYGQKIAYFDYVKRQGVYDFKGIMEILALENMKYYFYHNARELEEQIKDAREEGIEVVVASGICVIRQAQEQGMEGVMIYSSREAVVDALDRAKDVIFIRRKDREKAEFLKTIIDYSYDGVIAINNKSTFTHFNPAAEQVFKISADSIIGKKVEGISIPSVKSLFQNSKPAKGEVQNIDEKQIVFNRVPIHMDGESLGALVTFQSVDKIQNLEAAIRKKLYARGLISRYTFDDLVGSSQEFTKAMARAKKCARSNSTLLVDGEKGSGKRLFAHSIHAASARREGPFVELNCAGLPKDLLEGELFGSEGGVFSGTRKDGKQGLFELAHGGTIFLNEITALPLSLQSNLLRVLQGKIVRRVGGERAIPVDVRLIAATSRSLADEVKTGNFHKDLFFCLNALNLHIPPLRNRKSDIPLLVEHFTRKFRGSDGYTEKYPSSVFRFLGDYDWPGNVRELENFIEKYVILSEGSKDNFRLMEELLEELYRFRDDSSVAGKDAHDFLTVRIGTLKEMEREIIEKLYRQTDLDKKSLASCLGISRTTLWKKLKALEEDGRLSV